MTYNASSRIACVLALAGILALPARGRTEDYIEVSPASLGTSPEDYIGVEIKLKCRFLKLDSTWLGDSEVFRSPREFLGVTVQAGDRIFAQLFAPRDMLPELERFSRSDRMIVYGKVFSARYNFPWIDVEKISEGWVVGEEPEKVKKERREMARSYEEFLKSRRETVVEFDPERFRVLTLRLEALIGILEKKGLVTEEDLAAAFSALEAGPTPVPAWHHYMDWVTETGK